MKIVASSATTISTTVTYNDNVLLRMGTDGDGVRVHDSAGRAANAAFTDVLVGTAVYATAIPADSMLTSNVTADGDIVWFANTGGNSIEAMRIDASARQLLFPLLNDAATPTIGFGDGGDGIWSSIDGSLIFGTNGEDNGSVRIRGSGLMDSVSTGNGWLLQADDPTATSPVFTYVGDTDTGIGSAAADQLSLIAGAHEMLRLTESTALANFAGVLVDAPDQVNLTEAAGSTWRLIQTQPVNVDWTNDACVGAITALNGMTAYFDRMTNTADAAMTITDASTVYIVNAPCAGSNVTQTRSYALWVDDGSVRLDSSLFVATDEGCSGEQLTSGGAGAAMTWTAASSRRDAKNILGVFCNPTSALQTIVDTPVYRFNYREGYGTGDLTTEYVGPIAEEAPWAVHHQGRIVNPVNTLGYMMLGIKALEQENTDLRERVALLETK